MILPVFEKQSKHLKKKYPSFAEDLEVLIKRLKENPIQGDFIGFNCYKIRFAIKSKGKGKSSGARLISHIVVENNVVYLLSVYDKSEVVSISNHQILGLLKYIE